MQQMQVDNAAEALPAEKPTAEAQKPTQSPPPSPTSQFSSLYFRPYQLSGDPIGAFKEESNFYVQVPDAQVGLLLEIFRF
jgi:hypothetical protein